MRRYFFTVTGSRLLHIVREMAYHGHDGNLLLGLCGAWPRTVEGSKRVPDIIDETEVPDVPICRTCTRLYSIGSR